MANVRCWRCLGERGAVFISGDLAHFGDEFLFRRVVVNGDGFDIVHAACFWGCSRRGGHECGDLGCRVYFQFEMKFSQ